LYIYIYAASGIVSSFLTGAQDSHLQRVTIPEAAYIYNYDIDLLKMRKAILETCRGF